MFSQFHSLANMRANLNALLAPKSSMMLQCVSLLKRTAATIKESLRQLNQKVKRKRAYSSAPAGIWNLTLELISYNYNKHPSLAPFPTFHKAQENRFVVWNLRFHLRNRALYFVTNAANHQSIPAKYHRRFTRAELKHLGSFSLHACVVKNLKINKQKVFWCGC